MNTIRKFLPVVGVASRVGWDARAQPVGQFVVRPWSLEKAPPLEAASNLRFVHKASRHPVKAVVTNQVPQGVPFICHVDCLLSPRSA